MSGKTADALSLNGLDVRLRSGDPIVEDVDLRLSPGEILGLVGESGSGKTTTARALLGYSGPGVDIDAGSLTINGTPLRMDESMRSARGSEISYVPQDPGRSLNPVLRIKDTISDLLTAHGRGGGETVVTEMFGAVGLSDEPEFARRFPHQLSGGQQQRVCIAAALSCEPGVVVLDEPTTGLDVVTQEKILEELRRLRDDHGIAMVYVTHDLGVVAQIADRIAVMYAGRVVEQGDTRSVLLRPRHPYTRGLLASVPDHVEPRRLEPMPGVAIGVGERPAGCAFAPRCPQRTDECDAAVPSLTSVDGDQEARCLHWQRTEPLNRPLLIAPARPTAVDAGPVLEVTDLTVGHRSRGETVIAAHGISFSVDRASCVALVGESGSGKTTIARAIAGLHPIDRGTVTLDGQQLQSRARRRSAEERRRVQIVFQNPADALNPRHTVRDSVARPARLLRGLDASAARAEVDRLLERVRLPSRLADRYPAELSGGERQRVSLARALAAGPDVILCDEITSALDVSVQAAVLELLNELRLEVGVALLFITHDLGVVATIADDVLVLNQGVVCERGAPPVVLNEPQHPYTKRLLEAAPSITEALKRWGEGEPGAAEASPQEALDLR